MRCHIFAEPNNSHPFIVYDIWSPTYWWPTYTARPTSQLETTETGTTGFTLAKFVWLRNKPWPQSFLFMVMCQNMFVLSISISCLALCHVASIKSALYRESYEIIYECYLQHKDLGENVSEGFYGFKWQKQHVKLNCRGSR